MKSKLIIFVAVLFTTIGFAQEKIIKKIEFEGLDKTKPSFVKSIIKVKEGEPLDSLILNKDIDRLRRLPSFAHVYFQVKDDVVTYHFQENFTILPDINLWTVSDELWFKVGAYEYNLLGRNITLGGFYQYNTHNSYGVNLKIPFLFGSRFGVELNHMNWTSDEPLYFGPNDIEATYTYQNRSIELLGFYELDFKNTFSVGGTFFNERYNHVEGADEITDKPLTLNIDKWLLKFNYEYNNVKQHFFYVDGIANSFYFQSVKTAEGVADDFLIGWNDVKYYKRVKEKGNLAFRFRVGLATNNDSPFAPFALDNHINIRGIGDRIDRGTATVILNNEYRHTLYENDWLGIQGVGFVDTGLIRQPGEDISNFLRANKVNVYPGIGLRFLHKRIYNAVIRIDYGYGVTRNSSNGLVIGLGQYF
ncbi:POTRA domain-containing protein [Aureivirga marina]|uniref:POTRA domain-containing protein n=1 Tax=Aureivirga marina TaxID=1182451 RepID=UPI0018C982D0|nr:POTRA domain-containing protein [Aureivirga marina]